MDHNGSKWIKLDPTGSNWIIKDQNWLNGIIEDQIGFIAYGAALMIEIIFQSCYINRLLIKTSLNKIEKLF